MLLPALAKAKLQAHRINCVSNLRNVSLAFRIFSTDHNDRFPMAVPTSDGGSSEYTILATGAYGTFLALSNELSTPKVIICPSDSGKIVASNFLHLATGTIAKGGKNGGISYFVGINADETQPQSILSGDRNITNSASAGQQARTDINKSEIVRLGTNAAAGWTKELHQSAGNIALGDGSVQKAMTTRLREHLRSSNDDNTLQFPGNQ